ncbi:hypothetical protein [Trichocoleus sp. FACHB-69]|nr:hypothetical protein [Trichocoleus sp. FACHB-69]
MNDWGVYSGDSCQQQGTGCYDGLFLHGQSYLKFLLLLSATNAIALNP